MSANGGRASNAAVRPPMRARLYVDREPGPLSLPTAWWMGGVVCVQFTPVPAGSAVWVDMYGAKHRISFGVQSTIVEVPRWPVDNDDLVAMLNETLDAPYRAAIQGGTVVLLPTDDEE